MGDHKNLKVNHADMKTTFLLANIGEEVHITQPKGNIKFYQENKERRLNKAIDVLKQPSRARNLKSVNIKKTRF